MMPIIVKPGVTINPDKCEISRSSIKFLGQLWTATELLPIQTKMNALEQMEKPTNITELRRFLGMANQLGKFSPNLAQITQPLYELL